MWRVQLSIALGFVFAVVWYDLQERALSWPQSACTPARADSSRCAAYDFQYCGRSLGARDVAYLLARSADAGVMDVPGEEAALLLHYHEQLTASLAARGASTGACCCVCVKIPAWPHRAMQRRCGVALAACHDDSVHAEKKSVQIW